MWEVRWLDEAKTVGEIWRMGDYPDLPPAPCNEGVIRIVRRPHRDP